MLLVMWFWHLVWMVFSLMQLRLTAPSSGEFGRKKSCARVYVKNKENSKSGDKVEEKQNAKVGKRPRKELDEVTSLTKVMVDSMACGGVGGFSADNLEELPHSKE